MRFKQGQGDPATRLSEAERKRLERKVERRFRKELRETHEKLHRVERQNKQSAVVAKRYAEELAEVREQLVVCETAGAELEKALGEAETALGEMQERLTDVEWQRDALSARVAEAEGESERARRKRDQSQLELEHARGKIASLSAAIPEGRRLDDDAPAQAPSGAVKRLEEAAEVPDAGLRCGVCNRMPEGVGAEDLERAGWLVGEELCLCARCFERGWRPPFDGRSRRRRFHRV